MKRTELGKITFIDLVLEERAGDDCYVHIAFGGDIWAVTTYEAVQGFQLRMREARVSRLASMKDKPVEVTFDDGGLKSGRILTEVL